MRTTVTAEDIGEAFASPRPADSLAEIIRALGSSWAVSRCGTIWSGWRTRPGVGLSLTACSVIVRLRRQPGGDVAKFGENERLPAETLAAALAELQSRGLIEEESAAAAADQSGAAPRVVLTPGGVATADQLVAAVRARLERLLEGWSPEQYPDLVRLLDTFATEVIPARGEMTRARPGALPG